MTVVQYSSTSLYTPKLSDQNAVYIGYIVFWLAIIRLRVYLMFYKVLWLPAPVPIIWSMVNLEDIPLVLILKLE